MYIFRKNDGSLEDAPDTFQPDAPDFAQLEDVAEVLCISKILVKQLRLVAKPLETRAKIREEQTALQAEAEAKNAEALAEEAAQAEPKPAKRGRK